ncbi:unnamed protein product [Cuscuta campestris]|uniref:Uncharacterized protein n=1 Tax=Cuscuta campestris TaxID=132261 RepID=A0A484K149_9ASTE|nr:unnamed protein product [Cuscuta campestris]
MNINPMFPERRKTRRKKHFDESSSDVCATESQSEEESFRINYFLFIVDEAISSLTSRFEQYQQYENIFGFLFTSDKLHSLDDQSLKVCCNNLETSLKHAEHSDIDGNDLYAELKLLQHFLPK